MVNTFMKKYNFDITGKITHTQVTDTVICGVSQDWLKVKQTPEAQ